MEYISYLCGVKSNSMDMKAILLARVSTESQSYDAQLAELIQFAESKGYGKNDLLPIAVKESGIKLKEEERLGLNEMKKAIATGQYNAVFVWEISRLARTKKVLFSILDYFTTTKVQLFVKNPSITLFKSDGQIDEGAEMVFTLFAQLAEAEMRNKKDRFKRSKDDKKANGRYIGGYVGYGYKVENKSIVIDEEKAVIIRKAFDLYEQGLSIKGVVKEMEKQGYKLLFTTFSKLLVNRSLTGEMVNGKRYPQIITVEQFDRCRAIAQGNNRHADKTRNIYFGHNLLRCPDCGSKLIAVSSSLNVYECGEARIAPQTFAMQYTNRTTPQCENRGAISINVVDSLLWNLAQIYEANSLFSVDESKADELREQVAELNRYVEVCESRIEAEQMKMKRASKMYFNGDITDEEYDAMKAQQNAKIADIRNEQNGYNSEIGRISKQLKYMIEQIEMSHNTNSSKYLDDLRKITDDAVMYDIIHKHIVSVYVTDGTVEHTFKSGKKTVRVKFIKVCNVLGGEEEFAYIARDGKGGRTILIKRWNEQREWHWEEYNYTYLERFTRKK